MRVVVLVSGSGTILAAMVEAGVPVTAVLADRDCKALQVAAEAGIPTELVERRAFGGFGEAFDREGYTAELTAAIGVHKPDLVAMAGFGTVLSQSVHDAYPGRILNTHPSLLPAFPGWHAVEEALDFGVKVTGCTVHIATPDTDAGPILAQKAVDVRPGDTVQTLHERIKEIERRLYPQTVLAVLETLAATRPQGTSEEVRA